MDVRIQSGGLLIGERGMHPSSLFASMRMYLVEQCENKGVVPNNANSLQQPLR
jgi:hypothetical protein